MKLPGLRFVGCTLGLRTIRVMQLGFRGSSGVGHAVTVSYRMLQGPSSVAVAARPILGFELSFT